MSITINGTTGISGIDGSASTPAVQGSDTNTGVFFPAADTVSIATNGTERMRVDSSGNVGVGTSSPQAKLDINGGIVTVGSTAVKSSGAEGGELSLFNVGDASVGLTVDVATADVGRIFQTRNNSSLQIGQLVGTGGTVNFFTAATTRFVMGPTGELGIGGATYGTSGQVLTSGGSGASPSWTSSALGSTVVSSKIGSRATATTYQNTTSGWLLVSVSMSNNGQTFLLGSTSGLGITGISMNVAASNMTYLVPPSWYYRVTGTVITVWTEGQA